MHPLIALVTLLTVLLLMAMMGLVGRARGRHGVKAPSTTGPEGFERTFRVQMNTQESALMFLPALWTAAAFSLPWLAACFGGVWLLARVAYAVTYLDPARSRAIPFVLASLALLALVVQGLWGVAWTLLLR
ncbi:MAPEG family protein [Arenimonas sp.]|uniref:MAPEG family protein n=1 Tax=Arenimonas sp. TaxID=1872635 RepID=UPI0035B16D09